MSSLFTQINRISQEAQKQREFLEQQPSEPTAKSAPIEKHSKDSSTLIAVEASTDAALVTNSTNDAHLSRKVADSTAFVTPPSDVATSQSDITMAKGELGAGEKAKSSKRNARGVASDDGLGKGSRIDLDKLRTVIEEIAAVKTNAYGFSVRMSQREQADIEEFILDTLRREGIKGYEVSIAKLMRYAMRYMFRVHPQEFVTALRAALQVEESLSI